jgi:hypothetical protein
MNDDVILAFPGRQEGNVSCLYVVVLCEEDCNYSTWDAMHSHTLNALTHPPARSIDPPSIRVGTCTPGRRCAVSKPPQTRHLGRPPYSAGSTLRAASRRNPSSTSGTSGKNRSNRRVLCQRSAGAWRAPATARCARLAASLDRFTCGTRRRGRCWSRSRRTTSE